MKRLTIPSLAGALIGALFCAPALHAQGTKADTTLANNARSRVTDSLRIEAARKQGIRKTVVVRLAARADSLLRVHLVPVVVPVPPKDTAVVVVAPPPVVTPPPVVVTDTGSQPTRAELPRVQAVVTFGKATRVIRVSPPQDLQSALNAATPGDSLILSGTWTGNFVLPTRARGAGISVVGSDAALPLGTRQLPRPLSAKLVTADNQPALRTAIPTCGWRVDGLEITGTLPITSVQYGLLALGDGGWIAGGDSQDQLTEAPCDLVVSHMYIHGSPTLNTTRCLALNSANTIVRDSWISECHAKGFDAQAIAGWNGPGPYLIENNYLEGSGENVMFGGADPGIPDLVPCDITIRRNHIRKPPEWKGAGWSIKNLVEFKSACRVDLDANVIENSWPDAQEGMAIVIKSTANGCQCAWEGTRDLTFRWNIVRNAAVGLNIQAADDSYGWLGFTHVQRVTVEQSLFTQIGAEGRAALMMFTHDLKDITVAHSTFAHAPGAAGLSLVMAYSNGTAQRLAFTDDVMTATAGYALFYDGGRVHADALTAMAGATWTFRGNVVGGLLADYVGLNPSASWYPSTVAAVGLAPDFSLLPTSPFKGKGWNGTDPGVDVPELMRRTMNVVITP